MFLKLKYLFYFLILSWVIGICLKYFEEVYFEYGVEMSDIEILFMWGSFRGENGY